MNRREMIAAGAAAATAPSAAFAASAPPLAAHIIRLGFAPTADAALRARLVHTFNRFKQIKAPTAMIVGRDVSTSGGSGFDYCQLSLFDSEAAYRAYFFAPVHLHADKEGETIHGLGGARSFDIYPRDFDAVSTRLHAITAERTARFKAKDDRPTSPPVPDRPQDQLWNQGRALFYVARFGLPPGLPAADPRIGAFRGLERLAGARLVAGGRDTGAPAQGQEGHSLVVKFPGEAAYRTFATDPAVANARKAGLYAPGASEIFFVVDPADAGLASRLGAA